jgi:hypothetical protein
VIFGVCPSDRYGLVADTPMGGGMGCRCVSDGGLVAVSEDLREAEVVAGVEVVVVVDAEMIVRDQTTGLFGFRLELGRDRHGRRMQARRSGFVTEQAALAEYRRLCRQRDARLARPRLSDTVQAVCQGWLLAREQELQPNTLTTTCGCSA